VVDIGNPNIDKNCVTQIQAGKSHIGLFCLHGQRGVSSYYRRLAPGLGRDYSIFGINAVDTGFKRPPFFSIELMAAYYVDQIKMVQEFGPYLICGFSIGGLFALEVARMLRDRGEEIGLLAILDTRLPAPNEITMPDALDIQPIWVWLSFVDAYIGRTHMTRCASSSEFARMSHAERCAFLAADANVSNPANFESDCTPELMGKYFMSYVALLRAERDYRPDAYFGSIVYFLAEGERTSDNRYPYLSRWSALAKGAFELVPTPGDHVSMVFDDQNAFTLGKKLRSYLP
jgi:thioesterase domain-containing protein